MKLLLTGRDLVAMVLLIGAFAMRSIGVDGLAEWIIVVIAGIYLGVSVAPRWRP